VAQVDVKRKTVKWGGGCFIEVSTLMEVNGQIKRHTS